MNPEATTGLLILAIIFGSYFFPAVIGCLRGHPNKLPIFLLNAFLGWTFLGWIGALIWSATAFQKPLMGGAA